METILELLHQGIRDLQGRWSGPLHFRFFLMPTVVTVIAIRAAFRDARHDKPAFLLGLFADPGHRKALLASALKDIGRVIIVALILDTVYQLIVFHSFYVVQALIMAVLCAMTPYVLVRGPVTRLIRFVKRRRSVDGEKLRDG